MKLTSKGMLQLIAGCACISAFTANAAVRTTTWLEDSFEAPAGTESLLVGRYKETYGTPDGNGQVVTNHVWVSADGDMSKLVATNVNYGGATHPITNDVNAALVLNLETEGQTLTRNFGVTNAFRTLPVYVDTLIKFTPSEDNPTISDTAVKAAVFVNAISNLVVYHNSEAGVTNTDLNVHIDPTQWYRLTILMSKFFGNNAGFQVYVNDIAITNAGAYTDNGDHPGTWFLSASQDVTLSAVSFQGTGMIDELSVSDLAMGFGATPASILLTLAFDSNVTVSNLTAAVQTGATVASGDTIFIKAKDWYQVNSVSGTDVTYAGTTGEQINATQGALTGLASTTVTIAAGQYTGTYSTGFGPTLDMSKVSAWAVASGKSQADVIANMVSWYDDYLFNVVPDTNAKLMITSANVVGDDIVVVVTTDKPELVPDLGAINGTLKYYTATTLSGGFSLQSTASFTGSGVSKTITIPKYQGNFIKLTVE